MHKYTHRELIIYTKIKNRDKTTSGKSVGCTICTDFVYFMGRNYLHIYKDSKITVDVMLLVIGGL